MTPLTRDLCDFLDASPCNFLAVRNLAERLEGEGFVCLDFRNRDALETGGKYYYTVNGSALIAFIVGDGDASEGFKIISAHSDSPGFRIKPHAEMMCPGRILKLNTEVYGGPILYTWFDRPLSIAGRVALRGEDPLRPEMKLVRFDEPLLVIPHLAIHFNRQVNEGNPLSKQRDMLPVLALDCKEPKVLIRKLVAEKINVSPDDILDYDLSLYTCQKAGTVGLEGEMVCSGRIDDLSMVHAGMTAMLEACDTPSMHTRVLAIFDNEETGSGTKQGAGSPILEHILRRIVMTRGGAESDFMRAVASSFMVSADNAHGLHPNYVSKYDPTNHPLLGGGPCIKVNANCKYMTDADSSAAFIAVCERAGVPCQSFVNHSDVAGGSTLGNILTSQIPLRGVDMGAPVWAMHSASETASAADHIYTIRAFTEFYSLYPAK